MRDPMPGSGAVGLFFSTVWNKVVVPMLVLTIIAGITSWLVYRITRNEQAAKVAGAGALIAGYVGYLFLK